VNKKKKTAIQRNKRVNLVGIEKGIIKRGCRGCYRQFSLKKSMSVVPSDEKKMGRTGDPIRKKRFQQSGGKEGLLQCRQIRKDPTKKGAQSLRYLGKEGGKLMGKDGGMEVLLEGD